MMRNIASLDINEINPMATREEPWIRDPAARTDILVKRERKRAGPTKVVTIAPRLKMPNIEEL